MVSLREIEVNKGDCGYKTYLAKGAYTGFLSTFEHLLPEHIDCARDVHAEEIDKIAEQATN
jgi:hypothetical protein